MNPNVPIPIQAIQEFCRRRGVRELALFGSATRDDFGPESDIDVFIDFAPDSKATLFDLVDMREELQRIFGRVVDLVTPEVLRNPYRRRTILRDKETLYADP